MVVKKYAVLLLILVLGACNSTNDGVKTLNIAVPVEMIELSPYGALDVHSGRIRSQVFDNFFDFDIEGNLVPSLATTFTNINPTTVHITVRSNVLFHNGEVLSAEDMKYSLDTARATPSHQSQLVVIKNIVVLSPLLLEIQLHEAFTPLQSLFTRAPTLIVNKKAAEAGDFSVGTGPYVFREWNPGQNVVLEKFDDHWGQKASVDRLVVKTVPEALVRMIAVETGEVDIAYDIDYNEKTRIASSDKLQFAEIVLSRIEYLGFNTTKYPYNNPLFREAITYALDIPGIVSTAVSGAGQPANSLSVKGLGHTKGEALVQNKEKAKELLKQSGVPIGTKINILANDGIRKSVSEVIQANLKEIGIDVEILIVDWAKYNEMVYDLNTEMFLGGWTSAPDANLFYSVFFDTESIGPGGNFTAYSDPEMDALLEKAKKTPNGPQREALYKKIHDKTIAEKVLIPLYNPISAVAYGSNISNVFPSFQGMEKWETPQKNNQK